MRAALPWTFLFLLFVAACGDTDAPPLEMRVLWPGAKATIPTGVETLSITRVIPGAPAAETNFTVNLLPDDGAGRLLLDAPLLQNLPTDVDILLIVNGVAANGLTVSHVGTVGPLKLTAGERRVVDLQMFATGASTVLPAPSTPATLSRMLATATTLEDGRVLIAGGFDSATSATCPVVDPVDPAGTACFSLTATQSALIYDPTSGVFLPLSGTSGGTQTGLLEARGGHTATRLSDGRVLIAGGASSAILKLIPGSTGSAFEPVLLADATSLDSFELFAADLPDSDNQDPGRGGFVGNGIDATLSGTLNNPRVLHAAEPIPDAPGQVLLVGGAAAADSFEVFDTALSGGAGAHPNTGKTLTPPRPWPSTVALGNNIWIVGGATAAAANAELAAVWQPAAGDPTGTVSDPATVNATAYPNGASSDTTDRPELALFAPLLAPLADRTHFLSVGWLGPRCEAASTTPSFLVAAVDRCPEATDRNRITEAATGITTSYTLGANHAFGTATVLSDGTIAVAGGLVDAAFQSTSVIDLADSSAAAAPQTDEALLAARSFHASAALPGEGLLTLGGVSFSSSAPPTMTLEEGAEVLYLAR